MFEKDENAIIQKIVALQKAYVFARREFDDLKKQADEEQGELSDTTVELKAALKDSRIGDKTIRNAENEIAVLKKKISAMDSDLEFVDQELKRTDDEWEKLSAQKNDLMEILTPIKSRLQLTMDDLHENEKEMQRIFSAIEARKDQKARLTTEISEKLSNVATDKEQSDKALDAFSMDFGRLAIEREEIKGAYQKREKFISDLGHETDALKERCVSIEEVVALEKEKILLETHMNELEEETRTSREKAEEMQTTFSRKEADLKLLLSGKKDKETLLKTLADEVAIFDELAAKAEAGKNKLNESDSRIEETISELKKLFSAGGKYELEFGSKMGTSS
ncbi:MAG: hypothetical protein HN366_13355 [Deltaproteobacteria bacterium]|jgi:chromosome segregation ATPase|nr:hypothetical protein [Deltaproteobacteria bacterium]